MQREEEETNETNSRKRVSNESPDYLTQSSHCLCCSGQGGKPICFLWYCLGYKCHGRFPIHSRVYVRAPILTTKTCVEEIRPEKSKGWKWEDDTLRSQRTSKKRFCMLGQFCRITSRLLNATAWGFSSSKWVHWYLWVITSYQPERAACIYTTLHYL